MSGWAGLESFLRRPRSLKRGTVEPRETTDDSGVMSLGMGLRPPCSSCTVMWAGLLPPSNTKQQT
jgi:hypothetical protein